MYADCRVWLRALLQRGDTFRTTNGNHLVGCRDWKRCRWDGKQINNFLSSCFHILTRFREWPHVTIDGALQLNFSRPLAASGCLEAGWEVGGEVDDEVGKEVGGSVAWQEGRTELRIRDGWGGGGGGERGRYRKQGDILTQGPALWLAGVGRWRYELILLLVILVCRESQYLKQRNIKQGK